MANSAFYFPSVLSLSLLLDNDNLHCGITIPPQGPNQDVGTVKVHRVTGVKARRHHCGHPSVLLHNRIQRLPPCLQWLHKVQYLMVELPSMSLKDDLSFFKDTEWQSIHCPLGILLKWERARATHAVPPMTKRAGKGDALALPSYWPAWGHGQMDPGRELTPAQSKEDQGLVFQVTGWFLICSSEDSPTDLPPPYNKGQGRVCLHYDHFQWMCLYEMLEVQ